MRRPLQVFAFLALVSLTAAAPRKPGAPIRPGFNLFSKQQDIQLGKETAAEVEKQYEVVKDRALQDYIGRVGRKLAAQPQAEDFPYSFTLLNDKSVNAFALPGGPAFVFTGLIKEADNEAQLAGVLAHEISHVALRHGTHQVTRANLIQLPALLANAALGGKSMLSQLGQVGVGFFANSLLLRYSRDAETQADLLGSRIMAGAGYNPMEMARFFEKLEAGGGARAPQFFSDHPNPGNRVKAIEAEMKGLPARSYSASNGDFNRIKVLAARLPAPPVKPPKEPAAKTAPAPAP